MDSQAEVLLTDWFRRARESQRVHYECGAYFSSLNYFLGIPTIILTAMVGTAVFASFEPQILVGLVSILATILSGLQTFLGLAKRADQHRTAGAGYGAVRRSFEHLKTFPPDSADDLKTAMTELKKEMDALAVASPEVPRWIKHRVDHELKSRNHRRVFHLEAQSKGPEVD